MMKSVATFKADVTMNIMKFLWQALGLEAPQLRAQLPTIFTML